MDVRRDVQIINENAWGYIDGEDGRIEGFVEEIGEKKGFIAKLSGRWERLRANIRR
jgi:hypothetical protein